MSLKVVFAFVLIQSVCMLYGLEVSMPDEYEVYKEDDITFICSYTIDSEELDVIEWECAGNKVFKISGFNGEIKEKKYESCPASTRLSQSVNVTTGKAQLTLSHVKEEDNGLAIKCGVETTKALKPAETKLKVNVKPEMPTLTKSADVSNMMEGASITLTCSGNVGRPFSTDDALVWTKIDEDTGTETPVTHVSSLTIDTQKDGRGLATSTMAFNVTPSDNNMKYRCQLTNALGSSTSVVTDKFTVQAPTPETTTLITPVSSKTMTMISRKAGTQVRQTAFTEGDNVEFLCTAPGNPEPTRYEWMASDDAVNASASVLSSKGPTLTINKVKLSDAKRYTCKVYQNIGGEDQTAEKSEVLSVAKKGGESNENDTDEASTLTLGLMTLIAALFASLC